MVSEDWIEVAFVFKNQLSDDKLADLFTSLVTRSDSRTETNELDIAAWDSTTEIHHTSGNPKDAAAACTGHLDSTIGIRFEGLKVKMGSSYSEGDLADVPHFTVRVQACSLDKPNSVVDRQVVKQKKRFVEIIVHCTNVLEPKWGFGTHGGIFISKETSVSQIVSSEGPPLYEYNIFRSEIVDRIGRETVLRAPAWHVEELTNGSVVLIVREPPKRCGKQTEACIRVADYLGLSLAYKSNK